MLKGRLCLAALASLFTSGAAFARQKIKVDVTATLEGTYTVLGEDGIRGFQTALNKFGKQPRPRHQLGRFQRALLDGATRYLREEQAEPLGHRRMREGGISKPRI